MATPLAALLLACLLGAAQGASMEVQAQRLCDAVADEDMGKLKLLLNETRAGASQLRYRYKWGRHIAARLGVNEILSPVDGRCLYRGLHYTPLTLAARNNTEAVTLLLKKGALPNIVDQDGKTPLVRAVSNNTEAAKVLLKAGADVDLRDDSSWTPLMQASYYGNLAAVRVLLAAHADVLTRSTGMKTAEMIAKMKLNLEVSQLLKQHSPQGWDLFKYHITRRRFWVAILAGLLGGFAAFAAVERIVAKGPVAPQEDQSALLEGGPGVEGNSPRGASGADQGAIPRGAKLMAAKKVRGSTKTKLRRLVQVLANLVAPFGCVMFFFRPSVLVPLYIVVYMIPALHAHGLKTVVTRPVLMLYTANERLGLLRGLLLAFVLIMGVMMPKTHASDEPAWVKVAMNNDAMSLLPDLPQVTKLCIIAMLAVQGLAIFVNVLLFVCSMTGGLCCPDRDAERLHAEKKEEYEHLAKLVANMHTDWHEDLDKYGIKKKNTFQLAIGMGDGIDFTLVMTTLDCLYFDNNTILLLLMSQNYAFASILLGVVTTALSREFKHASWKRVWEERSESWERGYLTDYLLGMIDNERGFEAFFALALTTYSLMFAVSTPAEVGTQFLSLLSSSWGLAGFIYEHHDLEIE